MATYGAVCPLYTGAMAKGIASVDLVVACGRRGVLASFGAGGLPLAQVEAALVRIQSELQPGAPYAVNLIHSPADDVLERGNVDLFLRYGVRTVEASAFMSLTPHVVRYRVAGLSCAAASSSCAAASSSRVTIGNRILFKVSRTELAEMALRPPPLAIVKKLLAAGLITEEQAELSQLVPMADDVVVEADSGGHTDNRPLVVILPLILALRNRICLRYGYHVRVGVGGGIGCPEAA